MRYLVVAHRTADSAELMDRLHMIAGGDSHAEFVLLVPATPPTYLDELVEGRVRPARAAASDRARRIRERMLQLGLNVTVARVGAWDPMQAIEDELMYERYSSIVISTLPPGISRWLRMDLPVRLARRFPDLAIIHVVATHPADAVAVSHSEPQMGDPAAGPLAAVPSVRIKLDAQEMELLDRVLASYLGDLRMEVRVTDSRRVRAQLKGEEELVRRLITELRRGRAGPRRMRQPAGRPG